jgi:tRNA U38,U39,U40 pseudouridine synthase TruA
VDVALGKYGVEEFKEIFKEKNRLVAGAAAPAKGLILEEVIY